MDAPKTLSTEVEQTTRRALLTEPHITALTRLVAEMRTTKGQEYEIPDFDPLDGGCNAEVLFLLEAPGPKAIVSGFVSRNNPDETAKNFFLLNKEVEIDRRRTAIWNAVPWYIGSGTKIRSANRSDVRAADAWLRAVLASLPKLRIVMLVGQKALHANALVQACRPDIAVMTMPHPSPMFINRRPRNRDLILAALQELATRLPKSNA